MRYLIITIILLIPGGIVSAQSPEWAGEVRELINELNTTGQFDGQLVIGNKERMLFSYETGIADRSHDIKVKEYSRFDIASVNKSFIAALILRAAEEGMIGLDNHLTEMLSGYDYVGEFSNDITIHQMLSHTSGLPDYGAVEEDLRANNFRKFKRMSFSNSEYVNMVSQLEPAGKPGMQFHYSNFAYHLLSIILEDLYAEPFHVILDEEVSKPLGLSNTASYASNDIVIPDLAYGYNYRSGEWVENEYIDLSIGRRIFSTASDLYKWGRALSGMKFLSADSFQLMSKDHLGKINDRMAYGYGLVVGGTEKELMMGQLETGADYVIHGGSTEGYKSMFLIMDEGNVIISFVANNGDQLNEMGLLQQILAIMNVSKPDQ